MQIYKSMVILRNVFQILGMVGPYGFIMDFPVDLDI